MHKPGPFIFFSSWVFCRHASFPAREWISRQANARNCVGVVQRASNFSDLSWGNSLLKAVQNQQYGEFITHTQYPALLSVNFKIVIELWNDKMEAWVHSWKWDLYVKCSLKWKMFVSSSLGWGFSWKGSLAMNNSNIQLLITLEIMA